MNEILSIKVRKFIKIVNNSIFLGHILLSRAEDICILVVFGLSKRFNSPKCQIIKSCHAASYVDFKL